VSYNTLKTVDLEMERLLNNAYQDVLALLERNMQAYEKLIEALCQGDDQTLTGEQICEIVDRHACEEDLNRRNLERAAFL
jgi:ATP-dependent Zn protease